MGLKLTAGTERLAVCRLDAGAALRAWFDAAVAPCALVRTAGELSLVAPQDAVPAGVRAERDWIALAVEGPLDFALTGILASLAGALAAAGVPIFALSTYDTDRLLVPAARRGDAIAALRRDGHDVSEP
ncbi:MAG: ACT domain-containing protein [Solirubrobacteraceae bacterium]